MERQGNIVHNHTYLLTYIHNCSQTLSLAASLATHLLSVLWFLFLFYHYAPAGVVHVSVKCQTVVTTVVQRNSLNVNKITYKTLSSIIKY